MRGITRLFIIFLIIFLVIEVFMSINKYALDDINGLSEKINRSKNELLNLKMEGRVDYSSALKIIDVGINKDGDIIKDLLIVPPGRKVIFQFAYDSLQQDFGGIEYEQGTNSSYITAESDYLLWHILGINNAEPASVLVTADTWTQVALQLDSQTAARFLIEYNSKIYAATYPHGELFEWNGTGSWVKVASQYDGQTLMYNMVEFNGKLYAGTWDNGYLLEWNGVDRWVKVSKVPAGYTIFNLCVFNNKIYAAGFFGVLYEWNGISSVMTQVAAAVPNETGYTRHVVKLCVFNNKLYGGSSAAGQAGIGGELYEWNGTNAWVLKAPNISNQVSIRGFTEFNTKLYASTYIDGLLLEWNGTNAWVQKASTPGTPMNGILVFDGTLYGGSYNSGKLYAWNNVDTWVEKALQLASQTHIWNLVEFNGKLYGGTEASGLLFVWNGTGIYIETLPWNDIELSFVAGTRRIYRTQSIFTEGTYEDLILYARVEEQNSTPQRRSAPYWAFWVAYEVNI